MSGLNPYGTVYVGINEDHDPVAHFRTQAGGYRGGMLPAPTGHVVNVFNEIRNLSKEFSETEFQLVTLFNPATSEFESLPRPSIIQNVEQKYSGIFVRLETLPAAFRFQLDTPQNREAYCNFLNISKVSFENSIVKEQNVPENEPKGTWVDLEILTRFTRNPLIPIPSLHELRNRLYFEICKKAWEKYRLRPHEFSVFHHDTEGKQVLFPLQTCRNKYPSIYQSRYYTDAESTVRQIPHLIERTHFELVQRHKILATDAIHDYGRPHFVYNKEPKGEETKILAVNTTAATKKDPIMYSVRVSNASRKKFCCPNKFHLKQATIVTLPFPSHFLPRKTIVSSKSHGVFGQVNLNSIANDFLRCSIKSQWFDEKANVIYCYLKKLLLHDYLVCQIGEICYHNGRTALTFIEENSVKFFTVTCAAQTYMSERNACDMFDVNKAIEGLPPLFYDIKRIEHCFLQTKDSSHKVSAKRNGRDITFSCPSAARYGMCLDIATYNYVMENLAAWKTSHQKLTFEESSSILNFHLTVWEDYGKPTESQRIENTLFLVEDFFQAEESLSPFLICNRTLLHTTAHTPNYESYSHFMKVRVGNIKIHASNRCRNCLYSETGEIVNQCHTYMSKRNAHLRALSKFEVPDTSVRPTQPLLDDCTYFKFFYLEDGLTEQFEEKQHNLVLSIHEICFLLFLSLHKCFNLRRKLNFHFFHLAGEEYTPCKNSRFFEIFPTLRHLADFAKACLTEYSVLHKMKFSLYLKLGNLISSQNKGSSIEFKLADIYKMLAKMNRMQLYFATGGGLALKNPDDVAFIKQFMDISFRVFTSRVQLLKEGVIQKSNDVFLRSVKERVKFIEDNMPRALEIFNKTLSYGEVRELFPSTDYLPLLCCTPYISSKLQSFFLSSSEETKKSIAKLESLISIKTALFLTPHDLYKHETPHCIFFEGKTSYLHHTLVHCAPRLERFFDFGPLASISCENDLKSKTYGVLDLLKTECGLKQIAELIKICSNPAFNPKLITRYGKLKK